MHRIIKGALFIIALINAPPALSEAAIDEITAPCRVTHYAGDKDLRWAAKFDGKTKKESGLGVYADSFILLKESATVSGVDVSRYNSNVDFEEIAKCGGQFAYVRLSEGTNTIKGEFIETHARDFWGPAKRNGLMLGPYHFLDVNLAENDADVDDRGAQDAAAQAHTFAYELKRILSLEIKSSVQSYSTALAQVEVATLPVWHLPVVLDVETNSNELIAFRKKHPNYYRNYICTWIQTLHSIPGLETEPVWIYTRPAIWKDYDLQNAECFRNSRKPHFWIAEYSPSGAAPGAAKSSKVDSLCIDTSGESRCVLHQYTSGGVVGLHVEKKVLATPPDARCIHLEHSIDLDRFMGTISQLRSFLVATDPEKISPNTENPPSKLAAN